jgi:hypothetical protein
MEVRHELVIPNDDLPFRLFVFEGEMEITRSRNTGTTPLRFFWFRKAGLIFISTTATYPLKNRILCWSILMKSIPLNAQILISP